MKCASCGHQNRTGASFCGECGSPLRTDVSCPDCGASNPLGQKFCNACGHQLAEPTEAPVAAGVGVRGGRRPGRGSTRLHPSPPRREDPARAALARGRAANVTVLFADAMGFTPISEQLDQEQVYSLMQGCVARMMDAVHRYEGTVTQFLGDGVMALFGAPIAHEDSARRAVAAALEMQRALAEYAAEVKATPHDRLPLSRRAEHGPGDRRQASATTSTWTTRRSATRSTSRRGWRRAAEPGSVYLSEATRRAAQDYFEFEAARRARAQGQGRACPALSRHCGRSRSARGSRRRSSAG